MSVQQDMPPEIITSEITYSPFRRQGRVVIPFSRDIALDDLLAVATAFKLFFEGYGGQTLDIRQGSLPRQMHVDLYGHVNRRMIPRFLVTRDAENDQMAYVLNYDIAGNRETGKEALQTYARTLSRAPP